MIRRVALPALLLAVVVAVWHGLASLDEIDDLVLASPAEALEAFGEDRDLLLSNAQ
nr:ABC transporter permease [Thermoleophilaceae bacterium]